MRGYLAYVVFRALFVLGCLVTGLLGWPGATGAGESLLNAGSLDATGARRIVVQPSGGQRAEPQADPAAGFLGQILGAAGGGMPFDLPEGMPMPPASVLDMMPEVPGGVPGSPARRGDPMAQMQAVAAALAGMQGPQTPTAEAKRVGVDGEGGLSLAPGGIFAALRGLPRSLGLVGQPQQDAAAQFDSIGAVLAGLDPTGNPVARARKLTVETARASKGLTAGEALFAEFGAPPAQRTPYEASRAAMAARR